jgi:hypothetical protein
VNSGDQITEDGFHGDYEAWLSCGVRRAKRDEVSFCFLIGDSFCEV